MTVDVDFHHGDTIDAVFPEADVRVQVGFAAPYAAAVNYGSDPHWPPLTPMVRWTNKLGWENYDLQEADSEDALWQKVDNRRAAGDPLPGAYHLAAHIAENGTKPMLYASDAFIEASQRGEKWLEGRGYDAETPVVEIARDFANWSLELANDNLVSRVSAASDGNLQRSAFPAKVIAK
ncbi:hypothetical protein [Natronosalvus rutilus]|uniref:Uncharacterized protein n=1 Tax=Natronosalvus rutilus TaxID=2953753 RepID=A0A9E7NEQ9_9EURY|nr:hypothetical protein [Natronosalvus rutilus]UTF55986.1 hypothetical protein NGM29_21065 [Natronosalvus rutilus]